MINFYSFIFSANVYILVCHVMYHAFRCISYNVTKTLATSLKLSQTGTNMPTSQYPLDDINIIYHGHFSHTVAR